MVIETYVYRANERARRAEFLCSFYKSFFEDESYQDVRMVLDGKTPKPLQEYVGEEPEAFIRFLNFFELVAYMERTGNLSRGDVKALLGYYLALLKAPEVQVFINDPKNSFGELVRLLDKIA